MRAHVCVCVCVSSPLASTFHFQMLDNIWPVEITETSCMTAPTQDALQWSVVIRGLKKKGQLPTCFPLFWIRWKIRWTISKKEDTNYLPQNEVKEKSVVINKNRLFSLPSPNRARRTSLATHVGCLIRYLYKMWVSQPTFPKRIFWLILKLTKKTGHVNNCTFQNEAEQKTRMEGNETILIIWKHFYPPFPSPTGGLR